MDAKKKLKQVFPHGSSHFFAINSKLQDTELESNTGETLGMEDERKDKSTGRCILRYTSYRCKLLDPENLCTKFTTDALRYSGAIPDDTQEDICLEVRQKKVDHKTQEKTLIEIIYDMEDRSSVDSQADGHPTLFDCM